MISKVLLNLRQLKIWPQNLFNNCTQTNSNTLLSVFFIGACLPLFQSSLIDSLWIIVVILLTCILLFIKYEPILIIVVVFLSGFLYSSYSFKMHQQRILPNDLQTLDLGITGSIKDLPTIRDGVVNFTFEVDSSNQSAPLKGDLIKLSCYRCYLNFEPDQRWQLTVRLKQPHGYASWGAFDYEKYLFRHRFVGKGYVRLKGVNKLLGSKSYSVNQLRYSIVEKLKDDTGFSNVGLAMMAALMVGDKSLMSAEQSEVFQATGVSHLMAISGLHIGLVFVVIAWLFKWLSYPFARLYLIVPRQHLILLPALLGALFYAALAGFAVSTTRALIMLSVFVVSKLLAREVSLHKVLLIAACLIVLLDPFSLLDAGFWLSCGAVWVIGLFNTPNDENGKSLSLLRLQPLLWFGMLPMTALLFGQVSWVSPLVNLIVVPLFCMVLIPTTLFSLCLLIAGFDGPSFTLLYYVDHAYALVYNVLNYITGLGFAKGLTYQWSGLQTSLIIIALLLYYFKSKAAGFWFWGLMVISLFFPLSKLLSYGDVPTELNVVLLDVGQGLSMVIEVKGNQHYTLVYDTGPRYPSGFSAAKAVLLPFLASRGITKIDRLIISHADNDHIGGYDDVVANLTVHDILTSRTDVLPNAMACNAGQQWQVEGVQFEILSPDLNTPKGSNNLSCVLRISLAQTSVLITGDIEKQVERFLLKEYRNKADKLKADIVLVPHQGSKTSSTPAFIDAVQPKLALVAAGYLNHYGHPHEKVTDRYNDRGIKLLSTVDNGSVIIKINSQSWRTLPFRDVEKAFWNHQKKPN